MLIPHWWWEHKELIIKNFKFSPPKFSTKVSHAKTKNENNDGKAGIVRMLAIRGWWGLCCDGKVTQESAMGY